MPRKIHRLLAVDPGKFHAGVAYFESGRLKALTLVERKSTLEVASAVALQSFVYAPDGLDMVVLEGQQIYPHSGKDPNDMFPLAYCAGAIHAYTRSKEQCILYPREWTGGRPKPVNQRRILNKLHIDQPESFGLIEKSGFPASKLSHIVDAVGLGLYWYGVIDRTRVGAD